MVKIGILGLNDAYNNEDWYINNFSFKNVKDNIVDFVQVNIENKDDIYNAIGQYILPDETSMMNITDLHYDKDYVLQSIYKSHNDSSDPHENYLGSQLTRTHRVRGHMMFIKRLITNSAHSYVDFTFDDLYKIIRSTFVHNAIVIHSNGNMENFPFINDVLESTPDKQTFETIRYHEYKLIDYTMLFYCDITAEQKDENLNKIATTIFRKKIYGRVFVTLTDHNDENPQCLDLTEDTMKEIYHLHAIEEELEHTKYAKKFDLDNQENFPQISYDPNFFSIIHIEYEQKKNKPIKTDPFKFNDVLNNIK
jgi:hypothetical protein